MEKKMGFKRMAVSMMLVGLIVALPAVVSFGGIEPPSGSKISGKAIDAVLTAVEISINGYPVVVQVIVGTCNGKAFQIGPLVNAQITPDNISAVTLDMVDGMFLPDADPGCYLSGGDLVITKVTSFYNSGKAISAQIQLQRVE
jgi:hypothetical protein